MELEQETDEFINAINQCKDAESLGEFVDAMASELELMAEAEEDEAELHNEAGVINLSPRERFAEWGYWHIVRASERRGYRYPSEVQDEIKRIGACERIINCYMNDNSDFYIEECWKLKRNCEVLYDRLTQQGYRFGNENDTTEIQKQETLGSNEEAVLK